MIAETALPTLLEDWRTRRSRLEAEMHLPNDEDIALLKVLDYLIRRYEGTETAKRPAQAAPPQSIVVNTRAMIVHHHLWSGVVAGVKNRFQAQKRVSGVLHRIEGTLHTHQPENQTEPGSSDSLVEPQDYPYRTRYQWDGILKWAFWFGRGRLRTVRFSLRYSPFLPEYAVQYLAQSPGLAMPEQVEAVNLLVHCANRSVFQSALDALGERLVDTGRDAVTEALVELLRKPLLQEYYYPKTVKNARIHLREALAAEDPGRRRRAIHVLALLGDLHDIALLADLAAVRDVDTDFPDERAALLAAMDEISRRPDG